MKHPNVNPTEIMKYIAAHPETGRTKLAKMFNINEQMARELKRTVLTQAEAKGINFHNPEQALKEMLAEKGLTLERVQAILAPREEKIIKISSSGAREFSIGVVSDQHMCDKACAIDELHDLYQRFDKEGVIAVLSAGDITAGHDVYKGQFTDLLQFGFADQLNYVINNYPHMKNGIKTYAISGNHDLSFKVSNGAHFLSALADKRSDIIDCGDYDAHIEVGGIKIGMHHGDGGSAYASSYKMEKFIELIGAGQKPQIYILGHYHISLYMFRRNIHCFYPGCFQKPNDYSIRKKLPNLISGWIVRLMIENDEHNTIRQIGMENICYYD